MTRIITIAAFILFLFCLLFAMSQVRGAEIDDLVPFIIQVESSGNPNAVSKAGCIGLMQISSIVFREYCQEEVGDKIGIFTNYISNKLYNPQINITIGTWYLHRIKKHYLKIDGKDYYTIERMLASYNGGPTRMRRLLRQGKDWQDMPRESVNYVRKIMRLYKSD